MTPAHPSAVTPRPREGLFVEHNPIKLKPVNMIEGRRTDANGGYGTACSWQGGDQASSHVGSTIHRK